MTAKRSRVLYVRVPPDLHDQVRDFAADVGISITDAVVLMLWASVNRRDALVGTALVQSAVARQAPIAQARQTIP